MPREARFPGKLTGLAARTVALGLLLFAAVLLAARTAEPVERRVSWRGVSFVLPGGFVPRTNQNGEMAVFLDRLRLERELYVCRLRAQPGSTGEAEVAKADSADAPSDADALAVAYPEPDAILRFMFPRLLGVLPLGPEANIETGVRMRRDGVDVPFAAWVGVREQAAPTAGRATRTLYGVMVTTDNHGSYAVLALKDPAYRQDELSDRVEATLELLDRTLETVEFRGSPPAAPGPAARRQVAPAPGAPS